MDNFIIKSRNNDESIMIQKYLFKYGYEWRYQGVEIIDFSGYKSVYFYIINKRLSWGCAIAKEWNYPEYDYISYKNHIRNLKLNKISND